MRARRIESKPAACSPPTRTAHDPVSEADATSFVSARPRLVVIGRQVLDAADAADVVQDAWMRWQAADRAGVRDPVAFLTTTTKRLADAFVAAARFGELAALERLPAGT
jgi:RNA polymerase sigma-70 factor (ECF subfamily)